MSYKTDFFTAIKSLYEERTGKGRSRLAEETGLNFTQWEGLIGRFFAVMWPPDGVTWNTRDKVVLDYVIASAMLEWASINEMDAFDLWKHKRKGPQFEKSAGHGASIGPFQGYAAESYKALRDNPELRQLLKSLSNYTKQVGDAFEGVNGGARVPASRGSVQTPTADQDRRLRNVLSEYAALKDPYLSLVGKIQLSVDYAGMLLRDHTLGDAAKMPHVWRLPDYLLRHVLLAFETSGGDEDWPKKCAKIIHDADAANGFSRNPPKPDLLVKLEWSKGGKLSTVYEVLGKPWYDECKYRELVNIF